MYQNFYTSLGLYLHIYLYNLPLPENENIHKDLILNEYKFIGFNNNYNNREIINTYDNYYFNHGRFSEIYNLIIFPKGNVPKTKQKM